VWANGLKINILGDKQVHYVSLISAVLLHGLLLMLIIQWSPVKQQPVVPVIQAEMITPTAMAMPPMPTSKDVSPPLPKQPTKESHKPIIEKQPVQSAKPLETPPIIAVQRKPELSDVVVATPSRTPPKNDLIVEAKPDTKESPKEIKSDLRLDMALTLPAKPAAVSASSAKINDNHEAVGVKVGAKEKLQDCPGIELMAYPAAARRLNLQGKVMLRLFVSAQGKVTQAEVKQSSGYRVLDEAAIRAAKTWCFLPAKVDGKPIEDWYLRDFNFTLQQED
jgi:protein TonB